MAQSELTLRCIPERSEVAASTGGTRVVVVVHLKAPAVVSDERASRAPVRISAVIDRSGSMAGQKLQLVKKTLGFVTRNLKAEDQLGVVAYDDLVSVPLPLTRIDTAGRDMADTAVGRLGVGGSTNISGGLFAGLDMLSGVTLPTPSYSFLGATASPPLFMALPSPVPMPGHCSILSGARGLAPTGSSRSSLSLKRALSSIGRRLSRLFSRRRHSAVPLPFPATSSVTPPRRRASSRPSVAFSSVNPSLCVPLSSSPSCASSWASPPAPKPTPLAAAPSPPSGGAVAQAPTDGAAVSLKEGVTGAAVPLSPLEKEEKGKKEQLSGCGEVTALWLFTDGLANAGITDGAQLKAAVQHRVQGLPKACSVFSFGFGDDHDVAMLQGIAEAGHGMYYYIQTEDKIPEAFTDCLGGLLSVAAQNLSLVVRPCSGCVLKKIHTGYSHEISEGQGQVRLPDLYGDEERDIVVELEVPPLSSSSSSSSARSSSLEPMTIPQQAILSVELRFFDVLRAEQGICEGEARVGRPAQVSPESQVIPPEVDRQLNRIRAAEAMERAQKEAEEGRLEEARHRLQAVCFQIEASPSGAHDTCQSMVAELRMCEGNMGDAAAYHSKGSKCLSSCSQAHRMQRSSGLTIGSAYSTPSKTSMTKNYYT